MITVDLNSALHLPGLADPDDPAFGSWSRQQVEAALRVLPSHGWTAGWVGRRSRALLVLSGLARLPQAQIAELTAGDVIIANGTATIHTADGVVTLHRIDNCLLCGPCALVRWMHALDMTVIYPTHVMAAVIARAARVRDDSPHLCERPMPITAVTARMSFHSLLEGGMSANTHAGIAI